MNIIGQMFTDFCNVLSEAQGIWEDFDPLDYHGEGSGHSNRPGTLLVPVTMAATAPAAAAGDVPPAGDASADACDVPPAAVDASSSSSLTTGVDH